MSQMGSLNHLESLKPTTRARLLNRSPKGGIYSSGLRKQMASSLRKSRYVERSKQPTTTVRSAIPTATPLHHLNFPTPKINTNAPTRTKKPSLLKRAVSSYRRFENHLANKMQGK